MLNLRQDSIFVENYQDCLNVGARYKKLNFLYEIKSQKMLTKFKRILTLLHSQEYR